MDKKIIIPLLLFLYLNISAYCQTDNYDYSKIFGEKYIAAVSFCKKNSWIADSLKQHSINHVFAISIIFLELIRYNYLTDYIEVNDLKVLYVQFGKKYSDFSIGRFQMKPSFAEHIENDYNSFFSEKEKSKLQLGKFSLTDDVATRKARVYRLNDLRWQVKYLMIFIKLIEKKYPLLKWTDKTEKLRFYASAYNFGYMRGEAKIKKEYKQKKFYIDLVIPSNLYNYAEIALFYFKSN